MTTESERRKFHRIQFEAPVSLSQGGEKWVCEIIDISLKGILVSSEGLAFDKDRPVNISVDLSPAAQIEMVAQCSHSNQDHCGFSWIEVDVDSLRHLRRLLELNAGDEKLLQRELGQLILQ